VARRGEAKVPVIVELAVANAMASHLFDRESERRGVRVTQVGLLVILSQYAPITPTALEDLTGLAPTTLRDRVRTLVQDGYVHRIPNEADRRSYLLDTTPEGKAFLREARPVIRASEKAISQHLGEPVEEYRQQLVRLRRAAHAALTERPPLRGGGTNRGSAVISP
jgi:DNA-binding MarR family transcriptional regulator